MTEEPRPNSPKRRTCVAGCLILLALAIVLGAIIFFMLSGFLGTVDRMSKDTVAADLSIRYDQLKASNTIPPEHEALFGRLYALSQRTTTSLGAVVLIRVAFEQVSNDGAVNPKNLEFVRDVDKLVGDQGNVNIRQFEGFLDAHPAIRDEVDAYVEKTMNMEKPEPNPVAE